MSKRTRSKTVCVSWLLYGCAFAFCAALSTSRGFSQTNAPDVIPPLHPPRPEIPPGFWEQNGAWLIYCGCALVLGVLVVVYFLTRPRPPIQAAAESTARKSLAALKGRAEDGAVLSEVSQILRRYFLSAFGIPGGELNTTEFVRAVDNPQVGPELSAALGEFLRRCDERKFAPAPAGPELKAVARGAELVTMGESRRAQLQAAAAAAATAARAAAHPESKA